MRRVKSSTEDLQLGLLTKLILYGTILHHEQEHSGGENLKAVVATVAPSVTGCALLPRPDHSFIQGDRVVQNVEHGQGVNTGEDVCVEANTV